MSYQSILLGIDNVKQDGGLAAAYVPRQPPYTMNLFANLVNAYRKG